jgi:predicted RNase H-like HicB family nuclease
MKVMKSRRSKTVSYSVFYEQASKGGYVAFVPALPGCHTQGQTLEETERNVKEAIALYLESVAAHGEAIPEEGRSFQGRQPEFVTREHTVLKIDSITSSRPRAGD